MLRGKKILVVAGAVSVVAISAGTAFALWSANGSGSGRAKALTATAVTVNASTGTADLYPGFTGGGVSFTLTNANPYPVKFTAMTAGAVSSSDETNCPATNVTVGNASGLNLNVAANTTSAPLSISSVASMLSTAPDGCQGVVFTIGLTLTGGQV